jgi:hypothetical protein
MLARDGRGHAALLLSQQATVTLPGLGGRGSFPDVPKVITQDGLHVAGEASAAGSATLPVLWHCR